MVALTAVQQGILTHETAGFYRQVMGALRDAGVPFLVGGAYALGRYTGVERHTKDFDVFVRREDAEATLAALAALGCRTEMTFPHWLGKAYRPDCEDFIDVIFSSGNGVATVDDLWLEYAVAGEVLGESVLLIPVEEMIWSKAFVVERERFDGADICHLLLARGHELDWRRLLWRFGPHWRILLSHLVFFGFVYPCERDKVPAEVIRELLARLQAELGAPAADEKVCQGTLLSREQYLMDIHEWGYQDARLEPEGPMSARDIRHWTRAIGKK